ncbi:MAG TPA: hypothetical protein DCQ64_10575 [Candidatus Rokubacteria bacterium]|nr:hypothetical protein [Candidatus Rokubacteria bacterium]
MAVTMQYRRILIPAGVPGVGAGVSLYVRERRCRARLAWRMAGRRLTLALLTLPLILLATSTALDRLPELTSDLIAWAIGNRPSSQASATHSRG